MKSKLWLLPLFFLLPLTVQGGTTDSTSYAERTDIVPIKRMTNGQYYNVALGKIVDLVTKDDLGLGYVENLKVNLSALIPPPVTADSSIGYAVGSRWIYREAGGTSHEYVCMDATVGAAKWEETTGLAAHASRHASAGSDPLSASVIGAAAAVHAHDTSEVTQLQDYVWSNGLPVYTADPSPLPVNRCWVRQSEGKIACSWDGGNVVTLYTEPAGKASFAMVVDPTFNAANLTTEQKTWYDRLWYAINNPNRYPNYTGQTTGTAEDSGVYDYGRSINTYLTALLSIFRLTGEKALLDEVYTITQNMRGRLSDPDGDGRVNWLQLKTGEADYGTDYHDMDEMMTHSLVAACAYAFYLNRTVDANYAEAYTFWIDYLRNDFEAKWRSRNSKPWPQFPFLWKSLAHPYNEFIRYHLYMYKMTGDQPYLDEANRMASEFAKEYTTVSTPLGQALQWPHGLTKITPYPANNSYGMQEVNYARFTMQAMMDLSFEGFNYYGEAGFMTKVSNTLAHYVIDGSSPASFAGNIDGTGTRTTDDTYAISPFTEMGRFANGTEIRNTGASVLGTVDNLSTPRRVHIPAGYFFSLLP